MANGVRVGKIKVNLEGVRAVHSAPAVKAKLQSLGDDIAEKANASAGITPDESRHVRGFVSEQKQGRYGRPYQVVATADRWARYENAKHNTLLKALNDAKEG